MHDGATSTDKPADTDPVRPVHTGTWLVGIGVPPGGGWVITGSNTGVASPVVSVTRRAASAGRFCGVPVTHSMVVWSGVTKDPTARARGSSPGRIPSWNRSPSEIISVSWVLSRSLVVPAKAEPYRSATERVNVRVTAEQPAMVIVTVAEADTPPRPSSAV